ncbi:MAG: site-2 protease family protein [Chloroflexaceae bacterium]|nr:site-2 protease family protein [Chloroflexaceae bacterium]
MNTELSPDDYLAARQREDLRAVALDVMAVTRVEHVPPLERGTIRLTGQLHTDPEVAYAHLEQGFRSYGYTAMLQDNHPNVTVMALPGEFTAPNLRRWLPALMFGLTVISTVFVGGFQLDGFNWGEGLAFSAAILSILMAHEMGHFLVARRRGVHVSYPYFIPMPLSPIGTMGAFIAMQSPPRTRRDLLAVAIAGPVAGLVVAIPVLLLGLWLSPLTTLDPVAMQEQGMVLYMEGNSLLYILLKVIMFGRVLPDGLTDVMLHPVAFAGWVGILVTGLNLIPAGQLDGGHIFYTLFGRRIARIVTYGLAGGLFLLGFQWMGWFLWAFLILMFGQHRAPMLNELAPLTSRERWIALAGLALFVLVFTPVPFVIIEPELLLP